MNVTVNDEPHQLPASCTVAQLVEVLGLQGKRVAVERNAELVPRSRHADVQLCENDRVEVVEAIGGG